MRETKLNKTDQNVLYCHTKIRYSFYQLNELTLNLFLSGVARNGKLLPGTVKQVHSGANERKRLNGIVGQEGV